MFRVDRLGDEAVRPGLPAIGLLFRKTTAGDGNAKRTVDPHRRPTVSTPAPSR
jgi:hypothetical protein